MHHEVRQFVYNLRRLWPCHFRRSRVLEVGSRNVNGTVRDFFNTRNYLGIDLGAGPGVDLVAHVCEAHLAAGPYDVVISCEALEHDRRWLESLVRMWQLTRAGGLLIVTCAGPAREPHGVHGRNEWCSPHTLDYYRNLGDAELRKALPVDWHTESSAMDTRAYVVKPLVPTTP